MGGACNPYWPMMFAAASRVVQLAWDAWTTCRGIEESEISNLNAYKTYFDKLFVPCLPSSPSHTHINVLEPQLCSLKNFLNTIITGHANSTYCLTKHSLTRPHTIWSNGNDPKSQVNRHTYHQLGPSIQAPPSPTHSHRHKLTHIHITMTHLC